MTIEAPNFEILKRRVLPIRHVFILGAGASMPFGFPSGYELVTDILSDVTSKKSNFLNWGFGGQIKEFEEAIDQSRLNAIDDLIIQQPKFLNIGKAAIAQALIQYEKPEKLFDRDNNEHWYSYLFEHLKRVHPEVLPREHAFITFNYDRSLEFYLQTASKAFYGDTEKNRQDAICNLPILHVHGHLGPLTEQPYLPTDDRSRFIHASGYLNLMNQTNNSSVLAEAQVLIQKARVIRFLGFGYHDTNLELLSFDENTTDAMDIAGTAHGFTRKEIALIKTKHPRLVNLDIDNRTVLKFFREVYPLS